MTEGGFNEFEMVGRNEGFENYSREQLVGEYNKLKSDYNELKDEWLTHDMPCDIKVIFLEN